MNANLPRMSHQQRIDRRNVKHSAILRLLCAHELFTTVSIVALLLSVSESSARRALDQLVIIGLLVDEVHYIDGHKLKVYGITQQGLVAADAPSDVPHFSPGRIKSAFIQHKLSAQTIHVISNKLDIDFQSERSIRLTNPGLKKIPDGMLSNVRLANWNIPVKCILEVDRTIKSSQRYTEILKNHLFSIEADLFAHFVIYLFEERYLNGAIKLLQSIPLPECPPRDNLATLRQYRFICGSIEQFPHDLRYMVSGIKVNLCAPEIVVPPR